MSEQQMFQIFGIMYAAIGLGAMFNPKYFRKLLDEYIHNPPVVYLNGAIVLLIGYMLVTYQFSQATEYAWIIRALGWVSMLKGLLIIMVPKQYIELAKVFRVNGSLLMFEVLFILVLGAIMLYLGFYA